MKKWLWSLVVLPVALALVSPALAREGRMRKGFKFWRSEKIVGKLALSDEQIAELEKVDYENRKAAVEVKARLETARLELEHLLAGENVSEAKTAALVDKIADARRDRIKLRLERRIEVRGILTAEQWEKLEKSRRRMARKMKGRRSGGEGSHGGWGRGHGRSEASEEES